MAMIAAINEAQMIAWVCRLNMTALSAQADEREQLVIGPAAVAPEAELQASAAAMPLGSRACCRLLAKGRQKKNPATERGGVRPQGQSASRIRGWPAPPGTLS